MSRFTIGSTLLEQLKKSEILIVLASLSFVIATFSYPEPGLEKVLTYSVFASIFFIISFVLSVITSAHREYINNLPQAKLESDIAFHGKHLVLTQYFLFSTIILGLLHLIFIMFEFVLLNRNTIKIQYLFSLIFISLYFIGAYFAIKNKSWLSENAEYRIGKPLLVFMIWFSTFFLSLAVNNLISLYLDYNPFSGKIIGFLLAYGTLIVFLICAVMYVKEFLKKSNKSGFDKFVFVLCIMGIPFILYLLFFQ